MASPALGILVLLAAAGTAAGPGRTQRDKTLVAAPEIQWLKTYSLSPYKEHWTLTVEVRSLDKDLPRILKLFEKRVASLTQPLQNFPASQTEKSQQLSYKLSLKAAKAVLRELRRIGTVPEPRVLPSLEPVPIDEVKEKLRRLAAERDAHKKELVGMPAASALVEELLEHLRMVLAVREGTDTEVLLNMTVHERR